MATLSSKRMEEIFLKIDSWEKKHDDEEDFLFFLQLEEKHIKDRDFLSPEAAKNHALVLKAAQEMSIAFKELMEWFRQFAQTKA